MKAQKTADNAATNALVNFLEPKTVINTVTVAKTLYRKEIA